MDITPDVSKHCIKTALKAEYEKALSECLKSGGEIPAELAEKTELLKKVLEETDFSLLRSRHPELSGGFGNRVTVHLLPETVIMKIHGGAMVKIAISKTEI